MVVDWVMRQATDGKRTGIQWTFSKQLEDLDFADDIALLSHKQQDAQEKLNRVAEEAEKTGLKINISKTEVMRVNHKQQDPIQLHQEDIKEVDKFVYLGSVVSKDGGTDKDIKSRTNKARHAFRTLRPIWRSTALSLRNKIRIFNSNVKSVKLYGSETWRTTKTGSHRLQTFINRCLRNILNIRYPLCADYSSDGQDQSQDRDLEHPNPIRNRKDSTMSPRILSARFNSKGRKVTILQCYAPTNMADEEEKENFYEQLQAVLDKAPRRDLKILMGDLNAKVGTDNTDRELIMGKHGTGTQNENGELFTEFCTTNDLVIGGTIFPHKTIHKTTWTSPDGRTVNQIDHITIGRKWRRSLLDVRAKRGADAASDHHLVIAAIKIKLKAYRDQGDRPSHKYNVHSLKESVKTNAFRYIPPTAQLLDISTNPPTKTEIIKAIKFLKSGKAAGPDGIPPEALKADTQTSTDMLHPLLRKTWESESVPQDWKKGHLVKLPKKGDLSSCSNWRGIMLLSIPGKVLTRIILERLKTALDKTLREEQAGFRNDRSCTDHIATMRIIIEQSLEWQTPLYSTFVDFQKAFDSVDREVIWKLMSHYGFPPKFVNIIRQLYEDATCQVTHDGKLTEPFTVRTGVRQGCILSPTIFLMVVDWVMRQATDGKRTGIQWTFSKQLEDLDFADET
nr:hypothetical protein BaRGS_026391 [Batillaria attramentaria]